MVTAWGWRWTHPSVRLLSAEGEPDRIIVEKDRALVFDAAEGRIGNHDVEALKPARWDDGGADR